MPSHRARTGNFQAQRGVLMGGPWRGRIDQGWLLTSGQPPPLHSAAPKTFKMSLWG